MALPEKSGGSEVIYGRDYPSLHAKTIGEHSGVPFTEQRQLNLYGQLEGSASDQIVYAMVLARTDGSVEEFKAREDCILFPNELELASTV